MFPYAEGEMPLKYVFQPDNDPNTTVGEERSWFQTQKNLVKE